MEVIDSQSKECAALEDFFLPSNQWKCVYQGTVFDLDKCFSDVNKAGERGIGGEQIRRVERGEPVMERTWRRWKVLR